MDKELVDDYLKRTGMEAAQAEALAQILGQTATQEQMDAHFAALEAELAAGLADVDKKLADLKSDLTWRLVALMTVFAAIVTLLDRLVG